VHSVHLNRTRSGYYETCTCLGLVELVKCQHAAPISVIQCHTLDLRGLNTTSEPSLV
jgi:hypothetical protein